MFGNGANHANYIPGQLGSQLTSETRWSLDCSCLSFGQAVVGDGLVFASATWYSETFVVALDAETGNEVWRREFGFYKQLSDPIYDQGHVYVRWQDGFDNGKLWSFDALTGLTEWTAFVFDFDYSPLTIVGGRIYLAEYGRLVSIDQTSGERVFTYKMDPYIQYADWSPSLVDGRLYSFVGGTFREHSQSDGKPLWSLEISPQWTNGWPVSTVPVVNSKRAYVIDGRFTQRPSLVGIDLVSHKQIWKNEGAFISMSMADGTVYAIAQNTVQAFDAESGVRIATYTAPEPLYGQPLVTDDAIIVASESRTYVFDRNSRGLQLTLPRSGGASVANNMLYLQSRSGLYAYELNPRAYLSLEVPKQFSEEQRTKIGKGTISVSIAPSKDLVITLNSSTPSRLKVPQTVTISAGTKSANFNLEFIDNAIIDFDVSVTISASATGFKTITDLTKIFDDDAEVGLAGDWDSYGNGPSHTGSFRGKIGTHLAPELKWTKPLSEYRSPQVATDGNLTFVAVNSTSESYLQAFNAETGGEVWRHDFGASNGVGAPAIHEGRIYVHAGSNLVSISSRTGLIDWVTPFARSRFFLEISPVVSNGMVFVNDHEKGSILGFSLSTGDLLYVDNIRADGSVAPTSYAEHVYTWTDSTLREHSTTAGGILRSLDLRGLTRNYRFDSVPVIADERAFLTGIIGKHLPGLVGIDLTTFTEMWRVEGNFSAFPAYFDGIVYVSDQGALKGFDGKTGERKAFYDVGEAIVGQPIITDDAIIFATGKSTFVLNRSTGATIASLPIAGTLSLANDILFIADFEGTLSAYALHPRLSLDLPKQVSEKAGKLYYQGAVTLDRAPDKDVLVKLSTNHPDRLKTPEFLRVRARTTTTEFDVEILDNSNLDFDADVVVTASFPGYFRDVEVVSILDDEPAVLTIRMPKQLHEGDGTFKLAGEVYSALAPLHDTVIELLSSSPDRLKVPDTVVLKANTNSLRFDVTSIDNLIEDGPQTVEVRARAKNWTAASASTMVLDNETPSLTIIAPPRLSEAASTVSGSIHIPYPIDSDLRIEMLSTLPGQIDVPPSVVIRSGSTSATFDMKIIDDLIVNRQRNGSLHADATRYRSALQTILLEDNELPRLSLAIPAEISEGSRTPVGNGTVFLSFPSERDVEIALSTSEPARVSVPLKVRIPTGQQSITFEFLSIDNRRVDVSPEMTVNATATGWSSVTAELRIHDDEVLGLAGDWQTVGKEPTHAGYFQGFFGQKPRILKAWKSSIGSPSSITTGEGLVFFTSQSEMNGKFLSAVGETNGNEEWRYSFDDAISLSAATYADGHVYLQSVGVEANQLWSVNASTGIVDWTTTFPNQSSFANERQQSFAPTVASGIVIVGGDNNGGLWGFDQVSGESKFHHELGSHEPLAITFNDGKLYSSVEGTLLEHSLATGQVTKYLNLLSRANSVPENNLPAMIGQNAYFISSLGLVGIDLVDFVQRWAVPGKFDGSPAVDRETIFAIKNGSLETFDVHTGESMGAYVTDEPVYGQPIVTDDSIVVASRTKTYVFDRLTREAIAILPIGGQISIANNLLFVSGDGDLSVFAINPLSPWQNKANNKDVNRDGDVSPIDVLLIINYLNTFGSGSSEAISIHSASPDNLLDVDGDFAVSPLDLLVIINYLNSGHANGEGEAASDNCNQHAYSFEYAFVPLDQDDWYFFDSTTSISRSRRKLFRLSDSGR